jgi:ribonuclease BN (tRNA processing enzyme)
VAASLTLLPVGVGAAYARVGEAQSCYLVRAGGTTACLDLGAGALNRLQAHIAPEELSAVVITHVHPDHCADLFSLRVYLAFGPGVGRPVRLIGPPGLRRRLVDFAGEEGWERAFAFEALRPGIPVDLGGGMVLRAAEVPHQPPTYALRLERDGASLCYSADCGVNEALPELARDCDLLLCECSHGAEPVPQAIGHLNATGAGQMARAAGARSLLLTHCYPEYDRDVALAAARAAFDGPIAWARQDEAVSA